ncbi:hypothetical protein FM107_14055 [Sphingobacterium sp. JB170]|nr:hypothetical protein FM107_14055 [Sphingobacterium sp. JB170]
MMKNTLGRTIPFSNVDLANLNELIAPKVVKINFYCLLRI